MNKTPQEYLIKASIDLYGVQYDLKESPNAIALKALELQAKDLEGWISVDERLPEIPMRVYVYNCDVALNCNGVAWFGGEGFYFDATMISNHKLFEKVADTRIKVTHWMPLPTPPKQKGE